MYVLRQAITMCTDPTDSEFNDQLITPFHIQTRHSLSLNPPHHPQDPVQMAKELCVIRQRLIPVVRLLTRLQD